MDHSTSGPRSETICLCHMPNHVSDRGGLPVMGAESPERADAALNRRRILAAAQRLIAFAEGLIDYLEAHGEIIAAAVFGPAELRLGSAPYLAYRTHVLLLVAEAAPEADGEFLADALLATLSGGQFRALRTMRGMSVARIKAAWRELVQRLLDPADA